MNWLRKVFAGNKEATEEAMQLIDRRKDPQPIEPIEVAGGCDPAMSLVMAAALQSDKPVIGTVEDSTLTIDDA